MLENNEPKANAQEFLRLADAYADAAEHLQSLSCKGLSQAPFRLAAIHAIELYLTAVLLAHGYQDKALKKLRHDLKERLARAGELHLRQSTSKLLHALTDGNEYQTARYQPTAMAKRVQPNGLTAALDDVRKKAQAIVTRLAKV